MMSRTIGRRALAAALTAAWPAAAALAQGGGIDEYEQIAGALEARDVPFEQQSETALALSLEPYELTPDVRFDGADLQLGFCRTAEGDRLFETLAGVARTTVDGAEGITLSEFQEFNETMEAREGPLPDEAARTKVEAVMEALGPYVEQTMRQVFSEREPGDIFGPTRFLLPGMFAYRLEHTYSPAVAAGLAELAFQGEPVGVPSWYAADLDFLTSALRLKGITVEDFPEAVVGEAVRADDRGEPVYTTSLIVNVTLPTPCE